MIDELLELLVGDFVALVYPELRRIARRQLGGRRPGDSLESVALANEAYLTLVRAGRIGCESRAHFLALCAQIMRRILSVDTANRDWRAAKAWLLAERSGERSAADPLR